MVSEQEVINQLMQRFQMTTRLQSSKINLRLHPAELGELKIDLTVKEGTIKASVFAQNQHVQEILERNMPKLRATLEQQGFTIDEIVVSFRSETAKEFDLFDGQSARNQNFTFSENARSPLATFESAFDASLTGADLPDSGLSVRA
jgi:flagellar hook-length control protein FliK